MFPQVGQRFHAMEVRVHDLQILQNRDIEKVTHVLLYSDATLQKLFYQKHNI